MFLNLIGARKKLVPAYLKQNLSALYPRMDEKESEDGSKKIIQRKIEPNEGSLLEHIVNEHS